MQVPVLLLRLHTTELSPGTVDCVDSRVADEAAKPSVCIVVCIPHMIQPASAATANIPSSVCTAVLTLLSVSHLANVRLTRYAAAALL